MDKDEALYYKLEDYLDGKLPEKERKEIENRIATDEQVAEQLALVRLERELAGLMVDDELEDKMERWSKEAEAQRMEEGNGLNTNENNSPENYKKRNNRLPGLLLVLLALAFVLWLLPPLFTSDTLPHEQTEEPGREGSTPIPPTTESTTKETAPTQPESPAYQDATEDASPSPPTPPVAEDGSAEENQAQQLALAMAASIFPIEDMSIRSITKEGNEGESPLEKGYRLMGEGKLKEAQQALESISDENRGLYLNARQYLAYVYFEQKNYEAAIPVFEELIRIGYVDTEKMKWLLALSYLSAGKEEAKGLALLKEVAENDGQNEFSQMAKDFLSSLKEIKNE